MPEAFDGLFLSLRSLCIPFPPSPFGPVPSGRSLPSSGGGTLRSRFLLAFHSLRSLHSLSFSYLFISFSAVAFTFSQILFLFLFLSVPSRPFGSGPALFLSLSLRSRPFGPLPSVLFFGGCRKERSVGKGTQ